MCNYRAQQPGSSTIGAPWENESVLLWHVDNATVGCCARARRTRRDIPATFDIVYQLAVRTRTRAGMLEIYVAIT